VEGFKLKDSGSGGQSHNAQAIPSGWGLGGDSQSSDKYSSAVFQAEMQKTNNVKGEHGHSRSSCTPPGEPACSSSSLICLYTDARSMGNKQEELEICVQSKGHDLIAITETRWDSSHDWHAVTDGYTLFRKDRPTRRGGEVALYVREQLECIELCLGADEQGVEISWFELRDRLIWVTLLWVCTTSHLTRTRKLMRPLQIAESSLTVTGPGSRGGLQPPWHQLGRPYSQTQAVQEVPTEH